MKLMHDIHYNNGAVKYNLITNIFALLNVPMGIQSRNNVSFPVHYASRLFFKKTLFFFVVKQSGIICQQI